jgi:hypothetical protein
VSGWKRVMVPAIVATVHPNARCWEREADDGILRVLRTVERNDESHPWRTHVSISHSYVDGLGKRTPGRYPTWDEQKEAVWTFAPGKPMLSLLPPEGEPYVNVHETTFHWWETTLEMLRSIL